MKDICNKPLTVFDEEVVQFLGDLSAEILKSPLARQYPDLSAFAFYARKANLQKLKDELNLEYGRLGRGLCFHVTPANIPINFAFSWMFSLLAGNANIVRLPSKPFPQVDALLSVIQAHLTRNQKLETRNRFVRYPRTDNETTAMYSAMADCRMIWGGDRTIAAIKTLPTRPRCVDICFADRYSVALINADAVMAADDAQMTRLVEGFYNDTYLMDQNACSSPQVILWEVGKWGSGEVGKWGGGEMGWWGSRGVYQELLCILDNLHNDTRFFPRGSQKKRPPYPQHLSYTDQVETNRLMSYFGVLRVPR